MLSHTDQYDNPFARNGDSFDFYQEDRTIEPDVDLTGQSSTKQQQQQQQPQAYVNPFANVSGSIGSAVPSRNPVEATPQYNTAYTGEDTLDEPVSVTIVSCFIVVEWPNTENIECSFVILNKWVENYNKYCILKATEVY